MIHQPMGGARGQATDIEIQAREIRHMKDVITDILANATGKPKDLIHKDIDRDFYMSAAQAKEYGLIDDVLPPRKKGEAAKPAREVASPATAKRRAAEPEVSSPAAPQACDAWGVGLSFFLSRRR